VLLSLAGPYLTLGLLISSLFTIDFDILEDYDGGFGFLGFLKTIIEGKDKRNLTIDQYKKLYKDCKTF
jgi:hypothetical protein